MSLTVGTTQHAPASVLHHVTLQLRHGVALHDPQDLEIAWESRLSWRKSCKSLTVRIIFGRARLVMHASHSQPLQSKWPWGMLQGAGHRRPRS